MSSPVRPDASSTRFVLVESQSGGNVGSAARALKNLGFKNLSLVRPACDPLGREARMMAVDAADLLEAAAVHDSLDSALSGVGTTVGTSRRLGRQRKPHHRLDELAPELPRNDQRPLALVFGREDHGLSDEDLDRCTHLVHIPASTEYPSFNLAQAVLLCAWELRRGSEYGMPPTAAEESEPAPAEHGEREAFYAHLEQALRTIGFIHDDSATAILRRLRRLLGRAAITTEEVRLLRGLARQILWTADQAGLSQVVADPADGGERGPSDT